MFRVPASTKARLVGIALCATVLAQALAPLGGAEVLAAGASPSGATGQHVKITPEKVKRGVTFLSTHPVQVSRQLHHMRPRLAERVVCTVVRRVVPRLPGSADEKLAVARLLRDHTGRLVHRAVAACR